MIFFALESDVFILWVILGTTETARLVKETGQFFYRWEYYLRENDQSWIDLEYKKDGKKEEAGARQVRKIIKTEWGVGLSWWHSG